MSQDFSKLFISSFIIFGGCYYLYSIFIPFLRNNLIDLPNSRSSHVKPTPTSGGIIFSIIGSLISFIEGNFIILFVIPLSIVGFIDDIKNLKPSIRYFFQVITIIILLIISDNSLFIPEEINIYSYFLFLLIVIAFSGIINFVNFMDGIDGLVGGCMLVILVYFSLNINLMFWPLIPCLIAFLFVNWSPAKIFMGDSGSLFLGAVFVSLLLKSPTFFDVFDLLILSSPILLDATICVIRRFFLKQNIFNPHKSHLYQRMVSKGYSHSTVASIYILTTFFLSIIVMHYNLNVKIICVFFILFLGKILDKYFSIPFSKSINIRN